MDTPRIERPLGDLFSDLSQHTADLVRQEVRLAKTEITEKLSGVGRHAMMIGAGAVIGLASVMALAATIVLLLINFGVEPWIAALVTTAIFGLTAYLLAQAGWSALRKKSIAPVETLHSLKETAQWLKHPTTR